MTDRRTMLAAAAAALAWPRTAIAAAPTARRREVLAFYYGWYGNPGKSGSWSHWQGPGNAAAPRQSPTLDTPLLGEYDSHDPAILARHIGWARQAGITVLVSSWWGRGSFEDRSLALLLDAAHAGGLKVCVYLEQQKAGQAGAEADLRYLVDRYADHPAFLRREGRPVFFLFLSALRDLPAKGWRQAATAAAGERPAPFLIGDASPRETTDFAAWAPYLDGVHVYVLAPYVAGKSIAGMRAWAAATYPKWRTQIRPKLWCATVIPGFDDTRVPGRPQPRPTVPRFDGATLATLWRAAIDADPDWVVLTSFNEWHEGSEIEPSREYGDAAIRANRGFAERFLAMPTT